MSCRVALFGVGEGRAAGHPGVDVREVGTHGVYRVLDRLDRIRLAGGPVGRGHMQKQVFAVVRDQITVTQDTVLIPGGSEPVPRRERVGSRSGEHRAHNGVKEAEIHRTAAIDRGRAGGGNCTTVPRGHHGSYALTYLRVGEAQEGGESGFGGVAAQDWQILIDSPG
jgi:hypothetical protein